MERCHVWADKLDKELVALEKGEKDPLTVRNNVDGIVNQLVKALRARAKKAESA